MVKFLVSAGADVNGINKYGKTPLDIAKVKYEEEEAYTQYDHVRELRTSPGSTPASLFTNVEKFFSR